LEIYFVLVEPAVPENIGASARALKTMGFSGLRLVNPTNHQSDKARWLAHGSTDILESAKIFSSLEEAIGDMDFSIGTTAKDRSTKQDYHSPEEAREIVKSKNSLIQKVAIVFGREESGLTNSELRLCDIASTIAIRNPYPSLNLSQAVMLYAYIFSGLSMPIIAVENLPDEAYSDLKANAIALLHNLGIDRNENLYHRLLERLASADADDSRLLLSVLGKLLPALESGRK